MFWRALLAFLALPGMVAFVIPAVWLWRTDRLQIARPWGCVILAAGIAGLLWCVRIFYVEGRGTLAPWAPPQNLVMTGPYRYSRNPMYLCVLLIVVGWSVTFASRGFLGYAAFIALAFHLRVVFGEEPWLARKHGSSWQEYVGRVPRWFGFGGG